MAPTAPQNRGKTMDLMSSECHANGTLVEDALGNAIATVNGINDPDDNQRIARRIVAALTALAAAISNLGAPTYACPECGKADNKPECDCREDSTNG